MKCIYCKNEISPRDLADEHVFPKAFGCPDTWILDCVCKKCNNDLGGKLERYLASDTVEGLWRLQRIGSRSKKSIIPKRIKINIPNEDRFGGFKGAIVYADFTQKDSVFLPAQVLFNENLKFMLLDHMTDDEIRAFKGKFKLLANDNKEYEQAVLRLRKCGKKIEEGEVMRLPPSAIGKDYKLEVEVEGLIDEIIFRTIAKISFNYLAKVKGADYVLSPKFDSIREYIKTGRTVDPKMVTIEKGHILAEETSRQYFLEGHIFTIESRDNHIVGKVVLTNMSNFYYLVKLGELGLIWHDVTSGHAYSFKNKEIIPIFNPVFLRLTSKLSMPIRAR